MTPPRTRKRQGKPKFRVGQRVAYSFYVGDGKDWKAARNHRHGEGVIAACLSPGVEPNLNQYEVKTPRSTKMIFEYELRPLTDREAGRAQKPR